VIGARRRRPPGARKRRRFRFSLNGLAIQLSAFALSFTLVALLVVSGSRSAFVEPNQTVTAFAAAKAAAGSDDVPRSSGRGHPSRSPSASPTPSASVAPVAPVAAQPTPTPAPAPVVELTDSAAGTALFGHETLAPGATVERCIDVTYVGDLTPGPVVLYAAPTSGDLAPYLDLTIDLGTGSFGSCADFTPVSTLYQGTLADFAGGHADHAAGLQTWAPAAGNDTRTFRFSLLVRDDPAAAGRTAGFGFSWRTEVP
jgi:hypothetical protein